MGGRPALRRISMLLAVALLGFGAVAGGVGLADETVLRDPGGDGRVPTDPVGDLPGENDPGGGGGLGGGEGPPVAPPVVTIPPPTLPPPTTNPPGGGGDGGFGGGGGGGGSGSAVPGIDLEVTKTDSPDPVAAGSNLTYTVTVNNGDTDAPNVTVFDDPPDEAPVLSASASQGSCSVGGGGPSCSLGTLAAGASATATFNAFVLPDTPAGTITNGAAAFTTAIEGNTSDNEDTETTTVTTAADLAVTKSDNPVQVPTGTNLTYDIGKTDSPDPVTAGTDLTYTITATNNGPSTSGGDVTVTDAVPGGTTFASDTPSRGSCSGTTTVTCNLGGLANGASATITVVVHVDPSIEDGATVSNTTSVSAPADDPSSQNNSATEDTDVVTSADVSLTKEAAPDPVTAGNDLTYTITAANDGPSDAEDVTVTDPLPAGTAFVSVTPSQGSCSGTTTVTCELGTLADGASATITLVVHVDPTTPGGTVITNTATESSPEPEPEVSAATADPAQADNSASVSVTVLAAPSANASVGTASVGTATTTTATAAFAVVTVPRFTG